MTKYVVKVTYTAKDSNPNFAGQVNTYISGKDCKMIEEKYAVQWWVENYGYSRRCDANRNWQMKNQGEELYWIKSCEVVEMNF